MMLHHPSMQAAELAFEALEPLGSVLLAADGQDAGNAEWLSDVADKERPVDRRWVLTAVVACRSALDDLEFAAVSEAREHRVSWHKIGAALGISRQAAQKRWGWIDRVDPNLRDEVRGDRSERPRHRRTDRTLFLRA